MNRIVYPNIYLRGSNKTGMDKHTDSIAGWKIGGFGNLFAYGDPLLNCAIVANNGAAPVKATVAAFRPFLSDDIVASSAAQWLAIVQLVTRLVAPSSSNSWIIDIGTLLAEIGRSFVEEQISVSDAPSELSSFAAASRLVSQLRLIH